MIKVGQLLKRTGFDDDNAPDETIGFVLSSAGHEAVVVRIAASGKDERWDSRVDEVRGVPGAFTQFYGAHVNTVADLAEACACLPQDAVIGVVNGGRSGAPTIVYKGKIAHGEDGPRDYFSFELADGAAQPARHPARTGQMPLDEHDDIKTAMNAFLNLWVSSQDKAAAEHALARLMRRAFGAGLERAQDLSPGGSDAYEYELKISDEIQRVDGAGDDARDLFSNE